MPHPLLNGLRMGELCLVLGVRAARTPDVVRVAAATGHHAVLIDLEHSTMSADTAAQLAAAAGDLGLTPFVRIPERDYGIVGRLLDGGAHGIIVPRVETPAHAADAVAACRFPPRGQRSQIASVPQLQLRPTPAQESNPQLDELTIVQVLLETQLGISNAGAIAAVDGVDMLAIGANDLTAELGVPGRYDDPRVRDAVAAVAAACRKEGKLLMLGGIAEPALLGAYLGLGACPMIITGMDGELLYRAAKGRTEDVRSWHEGLAA